MMSEAGGWMDGRCYGVSVLRMWIVDCTIGGVDIREVGWDGMGWDETVGIREDGNDERSRSIGGSWRS